METTKLYYLSTGGCRDGLIMEYGITDLNKLPLLLSSIGEEYRGKFIELISVDIEQAEVKFLTDEGEQTLDILSFDLL